MGQLRKVSGPLVRLTCGVTPVAARSRTVTDLQLTNWRQISPVVFESDRNGFLVDQAWATHAVARLPRYVFGVLTDVMRGRPAVYATFSSYDEVAHHSGLERADTMEALRKLDQQFGRERECARHRMGRLAPPAEFA